MRIAFVIPSLGAGGAERVATLLANHWSANGNEVTLVTFDSPGTESFFVLGSAVALRELAARDPSPGLRARLGTNIARVSRLRSLLRELRPDVVVAFMTEANVVALWASLGLGVPVVISERNQPDRPGLGTVHRFARRVSYPMANAMIVQNDAIASWIRARFRVPIYVIPNPVVLADPPFYEEGDIHQIVSLGRLTHQKGFDVLVKSFSALGAKHPDWGLTIYGEGPDRANLERLRAESRCADRIALPGLTKDSIGVLRRASLFVLSSRFEGYPNALLEALSCGLPVIATACPGGTAEILANGVHGMLLAPDDVPALTAALDVMMSSPELRLAYSSRARTAVIGLDIAVVGSHWLEVLARAKS